MKKGETKGQDEVIRYFKEKLQWYAYECKPEEFDEKEVRKIVDLLNQLEPVEPQEYFNAENGLERFWKYYENRLEEDAVSGVSGLEKEAKSVRKVKTEKCRKKRIAFFMRHKAITGTAMAAVLLVMFLAGGTFGAYAEKDTGLFHWIWKDETGVKFITSPDSNSVTTVVEVAESKKYKDMKEVPEDLREQIVLLDEFPEEMYLHYIEETDTEVWKKVQCIYGDIDFNQRINLIIKFFDNDIIIQRQKYDEFDYMYQEIVNGAEMEFFIQDIDDETNYAICFYTEKRQYVVQGNIPLEEIKRIAEEYADAIL